MAQNGAIFGEAKNRDFGQNPDQACQWVFGGPKADYHLGIIERLTKNYWNCVVIPANWLGYLREKA